MGGDSVTFPCLITGSLSFDSLISVSGFLANDLWTLKLSTLLCFLDAGERLEEDQEESSRVHPVSLDLPYVQRDDIGGSVKDGSEIDGSALYDGGYEELVQKFSTCLSEIEVKRRIRCNAYRKVLWSYDQVHARSASLKEAKTKVLSYTPGRWMEKFEGMNMSDYDVPRTTTLLLIGPHGSGKSSLINRITKVFDDEIFSSERAQVSYNQSDAYGTYFLQEYMIPRGSTSFCLYDSRPLSNDPSDNIEMLRQWITKGVCSGELVFRPSDSSSLRSRIKCRVRQDGCQNKLARMINFVIFVIDGLAVLRSLNSGDSEGTKYLQMIAATYSCPYLSFKDDKPVVVVTHGDLLSLAERAHVRIQLGELLAISPMRQIFDIPESHDPATELSIAEMIIYSLEHADKHLRHKGCQNLKVPRMWKLPYISLLIILGIAILSVYMKHARINSHKRKADVHVDWHTIRHLWLE